MSEPARKSPLTFSFEPDALAESALHAQLVRRCRRSLGHDLNNAVQALQSGLEILAKSLQPAALRRMDPAECVPLLKQQLANLQHTLGRLLNEVAPEPAPADAFDFVALLKEVLLFLHHETAVARAALQLPPQAMVLARSAVIRRVLLSCILDALDNVGYEGSLAMTLTQTHSAAILELRVVAAAPATTRQRLGKVLERMLAAENASIDFTDTDDGYSVRVQLSNAQGDAARTDRTIDAAAPAAVSSHTAVRVMIVDSHRDSADTLALLLELEGYPAKAAYTRAQALNLLDEYRPTLVLLDLGLSDADRNSIIQRIRSAPEHRPAIVALQGDEGGTSAGPDTSFDAELAKPVELSAVRELIARLPH